MFERLGGRKLVGLAVLITIGVAYSIYKGDMPDNLMTMLLGCYSVFAGGNVLEHFSGAFKAKRGRPMKPESGGSIDTKPLEAKLETIAKRQIIQQENLTQIVGVLQEALRIEKAKTNVRPMG